MGNKCGLAEYINAKIQRELKFATPNAMLIPKTQRKLNSNSPKCKSNIDFIFQHIKIFFLDCSYTKPQHSHQKLLLLLLPKSLPEFL